MLILQLNIPGCLKKYLKVISLITSVYILHADTSVPSDLTLYSFLKIQTLIFSFEEYHLSPCHSRFSLHLMIHIRKTGLILSPIMSGEKHPQSTDGRKFKLIFLLLEEMLENIYIGNM